jgi:hypothetical protein
MNSPLPGDLIDAPNEEIPAAIPSLIDAAVTAFDVECPPLRRCRPRLVHPKISMD